MPVQEDLQRRDFTMNAMAICLNPGAFGELVDPFGGRFDLKARTLRTLHKFSFVEDPTRIFRAVRFEARFGFRLDEAMESSARWVAAARLIERLSAKRVRTELLLILESDRAEAMFKRLHEMEALKHLHPSLSWSKALGNRLRQAEEAVAWLRALAPGEPFLEWLVRFLAWTDDLASQEAVKFARDRLRMKTHHVEIIETARAQAGLIPGRLQAGAGDAVAVYDAFKGLSLEVMAYIRTNCRSPEIVEAAARYLAELRFSRLEINGNDLIAAGVRQGPAIGRALKETFRARLEGRLKGRQEELAYALENIDSAAAEQNRRRTEEDSPGR